MGRKNNKGDIIFDGRRWSNADADRIELSEPDPRWPTMFDAEAKQIRVALGADIIPRIEHVGSTAIPGIVAKPVIDILVLLPSDVKWERLISPLESLNYQYWKENPRHDRMFYVKGMPPRGKVRTHHVHVRKPEDANEMLLFRDHLIQHREVAKRYEALKRKFAEYHATDREAYTKAKTWFVNEVLRLLHI